MESKKLPKPIAFIEIDTLFTVEDEEKARQLVELLRKHKILCKIGYKTYHNCFECGKMDRNGSCIYGLQWNICPIGGLFSHKPEVYEKLKHNLELMMYDVSWLDEYYRKIHEEK